MPTGNSPPTRTVDIANREEIGSSEPRSVALDCIVAGIEAALPARLVEERIEIDGKQLRVSPIDGPDQRYDLGSFDRILLLGGGNAAGELTGAIASRLTDHGHPVEGIAVTTGADTETPDGVDLIQGTHPTPGEAAREGTQRLLELAARAGSETLVLFLVTGGGSALLPAPAGSISLADLQATTDALLRAGVPIDELNAVRKHCSAIKGGRLAAECSPATVVTLAISDVVDDDPATIASGPTVPDPTTYEDALRVLDRYDVTVPEAVRSHLVAGRDGDHEETPGRGASSRGDNHEQTPGTEGTSGAHSAGVNNYHLLGTNRTAIATARKTAREAGYHTLVLSASITGEAREIGKMCAAVGTEAVTTGDPVEPPAVVLSGGETTVTVTGDGTGGPNAECALAGALGLSAGRSVADASANHVPDVSEDNLPDTNVERIAFASVDTDGIDGNSRVAGGVVDPGTIDDLHDARAALARNDAASYLGNRAGSIRTGETGTNVNDLRVLVIQDSSFD